jgi:hypothetical protein
MWDTHQTTAQGHSLSAILHQGLWKATAGFLQYKARWDTATRLEPGRGGGGPVQGIPNETPGDIEALEGCNCQWSRRIQRALQWVGTKGVCIVEQLLCH